MEKRIILFFLLIFLLAGCCETTNTPKDDSPSRGRTTRKIAMDKYGKTMQELTMEEFKDVFHIWLRE
ncbi:MAG: hypothetical protein KAJ66_02060 [Candidatus Omnitrophica bacterium]|nr:hypothetical protein [Candidatus Omnitrophota bacterium]